MPVAEQRDWGGDHTQVRGKVRKQVFIFLGAPIAWIAQLAVSYFVIAVGCIVWSSALVQVLLYLTSIAALAVAVAAGLIAYRDARRSEGPLNTFIEGPEDRGGFFSVIGSATSLLFTGVILVSAVAVVLMSPCS